MKRTGATTIKAKLSRISEKRTSAKHFAKMAAGYLTIREKDPVFAKLWAERGGSAYSIAHSLSFYAEVELARLRTLDCTPAAAALLSKFLSR